MKKRRRKVRDNRKFAMTSPDFAHIKRGLKDDPLCDWLTKHGIVDECYATFLDLEIFDPSILAEIEKPEIEELVNQFDKLSVKLKLRKAINELVSESNFKHKEVVVVRQSEMDLLDKLKETVNNLQDRIEQKDISYKQNHEFQLEEIKTIYTNKTLEAKEMYKSMMQTAEKEYNESMSLYREQLEVDKLELQTLSEQLVKLQLVRDKVELQITSPEPGRNHKNWRKTLYEEVECSVNEVKQNLDDIVAPTWSQKMTIVDWTPKIVFGGCHVSNVLDGTDSFWNTHPANRCENYTWQIGFNFQDGLTLIDAIKVEWEVDETIREGRTPKNIRVFSGDEFICEAYPQQYSNSCIMEFSSRRLLRFFELIVEETYSGWDPHIKNVYTRVEGLFHVSDVGE